MAVFRIEKTRDYTVMSNHHLRDRSLSLKAKGLLSLMLSLPEEWDYTTKGLARICKDGVDSICAGVRELEEHGYVIRQRVRNTNGQLGAIEYTILEQPRPPEPKPGKPERENPVLDNPEQAYTPNSGAALLYKVLCSACANAENNHEMDPSKLYVSKVMVTGGPTMKRGRASARGRYARILKRTSHITVVVAEKEA